MEQLKKRIKSEGINLGRGILKLDSFLNHQVDVQLMSEVGKELARRFENTKVTKVLTAEISGIAPALMTAQELGVPLIYARKSKPVTMPEKVYCETAPSHTKGKIVELMVSPEFLHADDRVLIADDFLASGNTTEALVRIVQDSGATLVGICAVVEKSFEQGREKLSRLNVPIEAAAVITSMEDGKIEFADGM